MIINHQPFIVQMFLQSGQQFKEFFPGPADYGIIQTYLHLPDVHDVLLNVIQVGSFNVKRAYDINDVFRQFLPCFLQDRVSIKYGSIKIICVYYG